MKKKSEKIYGSMFTHKTNRLCKANVFAIHFLSFQRVYLRHENEFDTRNHLL